MLFLNKFKKKIQDSADEEFFKAGLCIKTIKTKEVINKKILFIDYFLDELTIIFEDESVIKFGIVKDGFFQKNYVTSFEITELLYKAGKITKTEFSKRIKIFEKKWNEVYEKINRKKDLKIYQKLKRKFE